MTKPLLIILLIIFSGCSGEKTENNAEIQSKKSTEVEDFDSFYLKFHTDSLFQMSRINFPLEGYFRDSDQYPDSVEKVIFWQKKDWKIHHTFNSQNGMYKQVFTKNDSMVIDKIFIENSGFSIERHFKLSKNKWYLNYFEEINL